MATARKTRKSKTNGTPEQDKVPGVLLGDETSREKVRYSKHWEDYYWRHRVEAHETLVPFRERLVEFLHGLEDEGLIEVTRYDVVEFDEEHSPNWEADKMQFTFKVLDEHTETRGLPNVSITLAAEGSQ